MLIPRCMMLLNITTFNILINQTLYLKTANAFFGSYIPFQFKINWHNLTRPFIADADFWSAIQLSRILHFNALNNRGQFGMVLTQFQSHYTLKTPSPWAPFKCFFLFVRWDFWYCGHYWPIVPAPDDRWWWLWRNLGNEDWQGKPKYSEETCQSATLSTTYPTWLDPVLNPGRRGGKPATNRLSYGAAPFKCYLPISFSVFQERFSYIVLYKTDVIIG
jgi:hypothetical protein